MKEVKIESTLYVFDSIEEVSEKYRFILFVFSFKNTKPIRKHFAILSNI